MEKEIIKVMIVEDEASIRKFVNINLVRNDFEVIEAESGEEAIELLKTCAPQVVVLDVMLPGIDGFDVCRYIREQGIDTAVVMLTARGQDMDKIMGLELGADDYMVKPFNPLELVARIRAVLRRTSKPVQEAVMEKLAVSIQMNVRSKKCYKNGVEIELTPTEFQIAKLLSDSPGKAFSRDELFDSVWGHNYFGDIKTLDVHIRRLRGKIEDIPSEPQIIETVWGFGYRWTEKF